MTISITEKEYLEQFQAADKEQLYYDESDKQDVLLKHNGKIATGWKRRIQLRGIFLLIEESENHDQVLIDMPESKRLLKWHFMLSGEQQSIQCFSHKKNCFSMGAGRYVTYGSGLTGGVEDCSDRESFLEVTVGMQPEVLSSFVADSEGELPKAFGHLVKGYDTACYMRLGETQPVMKTVLQQIIQCPYKGLTKRMYLEGKATELMALMLEEEAAVQQKDFKTALLQPDQLDRVYYAKEILLKNLSHPPSLMALARQVGMCDYNLKRGFKAAFGTTVFGYLRDRRLEKAQQLLLEQKMTVTSVARVVGYSSPTSFTAAFKRKFGVSPKAYQISERK
ncbi:MAG: AraC family transcriptional regulator [Cyanobacteria bacterium J06634_5]